MDDRQPPLALPMPQKVHLHQICNRATGSTSSSCSRVGLIIKQMVVEVLADKEKQGQGQLPLQLTKEVQKFIDIEFAMELNA